MTEVDRKQLLSTSSPEGIQIASKITPTRLADLLIRKGPLPIRHITSQLALEVAGFDHLSLSKQRRLIMAAMEQKDTTNNVVFEKIGWGQWAVRRVDSDFIVTEGTETGANNEEGSDKAINVNELRSQPVKLGWSKKRDDNGAAALSVKESRRESITTNAPNLHNVKLPNGVGMSLGSAIASDSDDDSDDGEDALVDDVIGDDDSESDDDSELFRFDEDRKKSPPIRFANRVPLKLSPPPNYGNSISGVIGTAPLNGGAAGGRRKSSSSNNVNKPAISRHIFNRSRLNSLENLDNYIISSKSSSGSFSSPPPPPPPPPNVAAAALSGSPLLWNSTGYLSKSPDSYNHRKSSFNESHVRSTLSMNNNSDTDEEDWATIGPESLRKEKDEENETKRAAFALVDLMGV